MRVCIACVYFGEGDEVIISLVERLGARDRKLRWSIK